MFIPLSLNCLLECRNGAKELKRNAPYPNFALLSSVFWVTSTRASCVGQTFGRRSWRYHAADWCHQRSHPGYSRSVQDNRVVPRSDFESSRPGDYRHTRSRIFHQLDEKRAQICAVPHSAGRTRCLRPFLFRFILSV